MFPENMLPTLDTAVRWNGNRVMYEFWEKPKVPNRVIQRDTALTESSIRSSHVQEVVRKLLHCCGELNVERKKVFLTKFSKKMVNSGFSVPSAQITLVHSVSRCLKHIKNSKLPRTDPMFKPIHVNREFNKCERKLKKFLEKSN